MITSDLNLASELVKFRALIDEGRLSADVLKAAGEAAAYRSMEIERILRYEFGISRRNLLETLGKYYQCDWVEYDERLPVPFELLVGLDSEQLFLSRWFPFAKDGETVIIAANDPHDSLVTQQVESHFRASNIEFRVALTEDILFFIQEFLNSAPEHIIGNERTGLAFWRNTMAHWRTRLACYRTDFAKVRTHLSLLRGGLGLVSMGIAFLRLRGDLTIMPWDWLMVALGFTVIILGLVSYFRIKRGIISPPSHQTMVEVTGVTLYFLEKYQYVQNKPHEVPSKQTMLARLADMLPNNCIFINPSPDNKVRSYLAHERTALAAQRTILCCYRAIYSRARTGLSFIRTGIAFISIGIGFVEYFGMSLLTILDLFLIFAGILMAVDGTLWYWPVRKEHGEAAKCGVIL